MQRNQTLPFDIAIFTYAFVVAFALTSTLTACGSDPRERAQQAAGDQGDAADGPADPDDPPGDEGAGDPSAGDPPADDPPAEDPPAEDPPVEDPPAEDPPADQPAPADAAAADEVAAWLTGRFDSSFQALRNPDYFSVGLSVCAVSVPDLGDRVLYVEQALTDRPAAPYRQRLYVVAPLEGGVVASEVYTITNEAQAVGLCEGDDVDSFQPLGPALREGCTVLLEKRYDAWVGGTDGDACASSLNGAAYATSEVELREDRVLSWDRGYDAAGQQVWGATDGPYEFLRVEEEAVEDPPVVDAPEEGGEESVAGETCEDAPTLAEVSEPLPEAVGPLTHTVTSSFGASNDYNPYRDAGLAPGCSIVYDAMGDDVVFAFDIVPGATLHTRLTMDSPEAAGGLYVLDDCAEGSWPDQDESGMCGRNEYRSHGSCIWGDCEPLDWEFSWSAEASRVYLVVDEVASDTAESFTLEWGLILPE